jgi:hypothetical protein
MNARLQFVAHGWAKREHLVDLLLEHASFELPSDRAPEDPSTLPAVFESE